VEEEMMIGESWYHLLCCLTFT